MYFAVCKLLSVQMDPSSGQTKSLSNRERSSLGMVSPLDSSSGSFLANDAFRTPSSLQILEDHTC